MEPLTAFESLTYGEVEIYWLNGVVQVIDLGCHTFPCASIIYSGDQSVCASSSQLSDPVCVINAPCSDVYYHWLFDVMPQIWLARRSGWLTDRKNEPRIPPSCT
jgi:hypothetical protein